MVAELVLQALDVKRVASAVGQDPRHQEAGDALVGPREHEEDVGHRRRAEPLVPDDLVLGAGAAAVQRMRDGRVRAHVRAALLLGHRHPGDRAALLARRDQPRVVAARRSRSGSHSAASSGCARSAGHAAKVIVIGQAIAGLGLHRRHVQGRARRVRERLVARPGQRVQLVLDAQRSSVCARPDGTRPRRCGCRSGRACAASACSRWPAAPTAAVARRRSACRAPTRARAPSRRPRARSPRPAAVLLENTSTPSSGGGWLKTVCVC